MFPILLASALLSVSTAPSGARLVVDGQERGVAPAQLEIRSGAHVIRAELPGHEPVWAYVTVGTSGQVSLALDIPESVPGRNTEPRAPAPASYGLVDVFDVGPPCEDLGVVTTDARNEREAVHELSQRVWHLGGDILYGVLEVRDREWEGSACQSWATTAPVAPRPTSTPARFEPSIRRRGTGF